MIIDIFLLFLVFCYCYVLSAYPSKKKEIKLIPICDTQNQIEMARFLRAHTHLNVIIFYCIEMTHLYIPDFDLFHIANKTVFFVCVCE